MEFKYTTHEAFGGTYERYEYQSMIHMKNSNSKPEDFTPEVRAWRAYQVEEVKKVLSIRSYLEQANKRAEIIDTLWTKEHADTASYGRNWGYYVGLDNIRKYYVDGNKFGGTGTVWEDTNVLGVTEGIYNDTVSVSKASAVMTEDFRQAFGEAMIEIGETEEGLAIIQTFAHTGYAFAQDSDYDGERAAQELLKSLS